jgi:hypothetical protein
MSCKREVWSIAVCVPSHHQLPLPLVTVFHWSLLQGASKPAFKRAFVLFMHIQLPRENAHIHTKNSKNNAHNHTSDMRRLTRCCYISIFLPASSSNPSTTFRVPIATMPDQESTEILKDVLHHLTSITSHRQNALSLLLNLISSNKSEDRHPESKRSRLLAAAPPLLTAFLAARNSHGSATRGGEKDILQHLLQVVGNLSGVDETRCEKREMSASLRLPWYLMPRVAAPL